MKSFLIRYLYPIGCFGLFLASIPITFAFGTSLFTRCWPIIELGFSDSIAAGMVLVLFPLFLFICFTSGCEAVLSFFKIRKSSAAADDNKSQLNEKE